MVTLIIAHDRFMACDSIQHSDGLNIPSAQGFRKIVRLRDGGLFGSAGGRLNSDMLRNWALAGMDFEKPPKLLRKAGDDEGYYWMWMRPDGRVFFGDYDLAYHETHTTDILGEGNACVYVRGVLDALAYACNPPLPASVLITRAMNLAANRCIWAKEPVYVFKLDHPELDP